MVVQKLSAWVGSSTGNAGDGESSGGVVTGWPGGGLIGWRGFVLKNPIDSSWGAELVRASSCLKEFLGLRIYFRVLALALELAGGEFPPPMAVSMDANEVLLGIDGEKVSRNTKYLAAKYGSRSTRYLAAKYGTVREAERGLAIALR